MHCVYSDKLKINNTLYVTLMLCHTNIYFTKYSNHGVQKQHFLLMQIKKTHQLDRPMSLVSIYNHFMANGFLHLFETRLDGPFHILRGQLLEQVNKPIIT